MYIKLMNSEFNVLIGIGCFNKPDRNFYQPVSNRFSLI